MIPIVIAGALAYDQKYAETLSHYTAAIRCPPDQLTTWTCSKCRELPLLDHRVILNKTTNILGICGYLPNSSQILFAFRRTEDVRNDIEDLNFQQFDYSGCSGCKVHLGFLQAYHSISVEVMACATELVQKYPWAPITVAGHSLGSAIATIAALRLNEKFNRVRKLTKYGAPRVGNQKFAEYLKQQIPNAVRVVHNRDLVPHLPPESFGFRHEPTQIFYDQQFVDYRECDQTGEDWACSKGVRDPNLADHDLYFIMQLC